MNYKERASAIGQIMTNARSKSELLSKTTKTRIQEKLIEDLFGIKKEFWSKYTDKGINQENESIKLFERVSGLFGISKNEESFENEYFTGTPDIITDNEIIDCKTSWSGSTFPWFESELPNKDYYYQLMVYMGLTGRKNARVVYCLVDASEDMIQDEVRRECWRQKIIDIDSKEADKIENKVREQMTFTRIPEALRVKEFKIEFDQEIYDSIIERVELCRDYYEQLKEELLTKTT